MMYSALRRTVGSLSVLAGIGGPLSAQLTPLATAIDVRIEPAAADLSRIGTLLIDRSGNAIVTQPDDHLVRYFNGDGTSSTFGREGEGPGEFRNGWLAGWLADTIWVSDPTQRRITLIGPGKKLIRSLPFLSSFTAGPSEPGYAAFVAAFPQALLARGSMLILGVFGASAPRPAWALNSSPGTSPVFRADASGRVSRVVAWTEEHECSKSFAMGSGGRGTVGVPFCATPVLGVAADGSRLALVGASRTPGAFRVTVITANGDTTFARDFSYRPIPIPKQVADSVRAKRIASATKGPPERLDAIKSIAYPTTLPPFRGVVIGDATVWIETPTLEATHLWMGIDKAGRIIGTVSLPSNTTLHAVSGKFLWASTTNESDELGLVRYRIVTK